MIRGFFAENDLQLKASCGSTTPCTCKISQKKILKSILALYGGLSSELTFEKFCHLPTMKCDSALLNLKIFKFPFALFMRVAPPQKKTNKKCP